MKASHAFSRRRCARRVRHAPASLRFTRLQLEMLEPRLLLDGEFWLAAMTPLGAANKPFDRLELTFSQAVDEATFDPTDVTLTGPGGARQPQSLTPLGDNRYEADFAGQTGLANYALTIGPDIRDVAGRAMDQNRDGTTGDGYAGALFTSGVTLQEGDVTYDGQSLILYGGTSTINGAHHFADVQLLAGATLTHSAATTTQEYRLELTIDDRLLIDTTSKIDVSGRGYLPGRTLGNTTVGAATGHAGGSYGGLGAGSSTNNVYGDFRNPRELGSGGAGSAGYTGAGGGGVQIVARELTLEGALRANGGNGSNIGGSASGGAGSGGAVFLEVGILSGSGTISADGGNATTSRAGGGGRVAVCYDTLTGFTSDRILARGGTASSVANHGAVGTVYLEQRGGPTELILDSRGRTSGAWTPLSVVGGTTLAGDRLEIAGPGVAVGALDGLVFHVPEINVSGGATLEVATPQPTDTAIVATTVNITGGSVLTHRAASTSREYTLRMTADSVLVDATSTIDVSGRGYLPGRTLGNTTVGAATGHAGGSYGGLGAGSSTNNVYGDFRNPRELGSGGAGSAGYTGAGGGGVQIAARVLTLEGALRANGGNGSHIGGTASGGAGSGGAVFLEVGILSGSGTISADGGNATTANAGGGGRVAVCYDTLAGFTADRILARGGTASSVANHGAVGTVYLEQRGGPTQLILDSHGRTSGAWTPLSVVGGTTLAGDRLEIAGPGVAVGALDGLVFHVPEINVSGGATLEVATPQPTDTAIVATTVNITGGSRLTHRAASTSREYSLRMTADSVLVDATSTIDVSGRGYLPGRTLGNTTVGAATSYAGGSYGGLGAGSSTNNVYGDFRNPRELGSGGAGSAGYTGAGGGSVQIAARVLTLEGVLRANGGNGSNIGGSASGGAGSGGAVSLDVGLLSGSGTISADGGNATTSRAGGGGRVAVCYDTLTGFTSDRILARGGTASSVTNHGAVGTVYLEQRGGPTQLMVDSHGRTSGAWTPLSVVGGTTLAGDRLEIAGPGVAVGALDGLVFHVPEINVSGGATLEVATPQPTDTAIVATTVSITGGSTLTHRAASTSREYSLRIAADAVLVDASSTIDVTGRGYLPGRTLGNTTTGAAAGASGGSYGGYGYGGTLASQRTNEVYGDFRNPDELGSGGAGSAAYPAAGGGLVRINSATLTLDGTIRANGGNGRSASDKSGGGGSGGAVYLDVGTLAGAGTISADGGLHTSSGYAGGGGRVAVYYDQLASFDLSKVLSRGGTSASGSGHGAVGTVYLEQRGGRSQLILDSRGRTSAMKTPLGVVDGQRLTVDELLILGPGVWAVPHHALTLATRELSVADGATLEVVAPQPSAPGIETGVLALRTGATLTHAATTTTQEYMLRIAAQTVTIDAASQIHVSWRGYLDNYTLGNTPTGGATKTSGGSYGGRGCNADGGQSNAVYGDPRHPDELGSGGGGYNGFAGAGGGLVSIVAQAITLDGAIYADGQPSGEGDSFFKPSYGGGGSGGGVYLAANSISGTGSISARGGNAHRSDRAVLGAGGGGRVALQSRNLQFPAANISAAGGTGICPGQEGTVFLASQGTWIASPLRAGQIVAGDVLRLAGQAPALNEGVPTAYDWDFGDGRHAAVANPGLVAFPVAGQQTVVFNVLDSQGRPLPLPDSRTFTVVTPNGPLPDLAVANVDVPPRLTVGDRIQIGYQVANRGDGDLAGQSWTDTLYLSHDPYLDGWDQPLASVRVTQDVAAGQSYAGQFEVTLTDAYDGLYYLLVSVDDRWEVLERRQLNNEFAATAELNIRRLELGVPLGGQFTADGQTQYYRVDLPRFAHLLVELQDADDRGVNELYLRQGSLPTRSAYDYRFPHAGQADQRVLAADAAPGEWYVLAYAAGIEGPGDFTLLATLSDIILGDVFPARQGLAPGVPLAPVTLTGAGFDTATAVELIDSQGTAIALDHVEFLSGREVRASLSEIALTPGVYDVRVTRADGLAAKLDDALTLTVGGEVRLSTRVITPQWLGFHVPGTLYVEFANVGDVAVPAPILYLTARDSQGNQAAAMTLDIGLMRQDRGGWDFRNFDPQVQFVACGQNPQWLLPGESGRVPVYWAGWQAGVVQGTVFEFHLSRIDEAATQPVAWAAIEPLVRPAGLADAQWQTIWPRLTATIGDTWAAYATTLRATSQRLARRGERVIDVEALWEFLLREAAGESVHAILGQVRDADTGRPVRNMDVLARAVDGSWRSAGTTDGNGEFVIDRLRPGRYELVVDGYAVTGSAAQFEVPDAGDIDDAVLLVLPAVPDPVTPESAIVSDDDPYVTVGPQGESLLVWQRGREIWFATNTGGGWEGAAVPGAFGSDPVVMAVPRGAGQRPDVVVVWQSDQGSGSQLLTAVRRDDGGGPVWSAPRPAGTADVTNSAPALALAQGVPLLVWQKRDATMVDDTDLYYQLLVLETGEGEPQVFVCTAGCRAAAGEGPGNFSLPLSFERETTLPKWLPLVGGRSGVKIQGELAGSLEDCRLGMAGRIGGELELFDGRATGAASLNASAQWLVRADDADCCAWQFDQAQLGARIEVNAKIPAFALDVVVAKLEVGAVVGGGLDGTMTWRGGNFPGWPSEAQVGADLTLGAYGNVELLFGAFTGDVQGTGTLRGVVDAQGFRFDSVTIDLSAEVSAFWFLSKDWQQTWQWPEKPSAGEAEGLLGGEFGPAYVNPKTGTGQVYSGLPVLSGVAADRYNDGRPVLLPLAGGETLLAWIKDSDRTDWLGGALTVASWDGTSWSAPLEIPGARGFGYTPAAITDADGDPVLIWPWADSSGLTLNDPAEELLDRMLATDLVYSVRKGGVWSAPAPLARLDGFDRDVSAALAPDGRLVAAWVNQTDAGEQLLASFLDQGQWTVPQQIAAGYHLSNTAVGIVGGQPTILWTAGREIEGRAAEESLMQAVWDGGWTAAAPLVLGAAGGEPLAGAALPHAGALWSPAGGSTANPAAAPQAVPTAEPSPPPASTMSGLPAGVGAALQGEAGSTIIVNLTDDRTDPDNTDGVCDVDSLQPGEQCTLRAAIHEANRRPGQDTIVFAIPDGVPRVIRPLSGLPAITQSLTIDGATASVVLDGTQAGVAADGLTVDTDGVAVRGLVILSFRGAGIRVETEAERCLLELENVEVRDAYGAGILINVSANLGGGLEAGGTVTVQATGTQIVANGGDGIFVYTGDLELWGTGTRLADNQGWGIAVNAGSLEIGAEALDRVSGNQAGGIRVGDAGMYGHGLVLPRGLVVENNRGPGIQAILEDVPEVVLEDVKVRNNGAGIQYLATGDGAGRLEIRGTDNQFTGNQGVGIGAASDLLISGRTEIHDNQGWGIELDGGRLEIQEGAVDRIYRNSQGGIHLGVMTQGLKLPRGVIVEDNGGWGISGASRDLLVVLEDVKIRNNGGGGLSLLLQQSDENLLTDPPQIVVIRGSQNEFTGNRGGTGLAVVADLQIEGRTQIHDNQGWGIEIDGGRLEIQEGAVDRIYRNSQGGIHLGVMTQGLKLPRGVIVEDNGGWGISGASRDLLVVLEDVKIRNNGGGGLSLLLQQSDENFLADPPQVVIIRGRENEFSDNGLGGLWVGADYLRIEGQAKVVHNGGHGLEMESGLLSADSLIVTHNASDGIHSGGTVTIQNGKVCYNQGQQIVAAKQHLTNVNVGCKEEFATPCCTLIPVPDACCQQARDRNSQLDDTRLPSAPQVPLVPLHGTQKEPVMSRDPNEKVGPEGFGPQRFTAGDQVLPYQINFENEASATAPAQVVIITDQLDSDLDWRTFEFIEFAFGSHLIPAPARTQAFTAVEPLRYNGQDLLVHIQAGLDLQTGIVETRFWTTDITGWPPDAMTGFLPPEDGSGRGQGHVSYLIQAQPGLATGTAIRNVATIQFDFAETIATNQVDPHDPSKGTDPAKEALVTIDAGAPTSQVEPLAASSAHQFWLAWGGHDEGGVGSGIAAYDVYVSDDGGPYTRWLENTAKVADVFTGQVNHTYRFYSVAADNVGHREAAPAADTETRVVRTNWQNPWKRWDVGGEGDVEPKDVLYLINHINAHPGDSSLPAPPAVPPLYYDVNNDGLCTAGDVLDVINWINSHPGAGGEAEAAGPVAGDLSAAGLTDAAWFISSRGEGSGASATATIAAWTDAPGRADAWWTRYASRSDDLTKVWTTTRQQTDVAARSPESICPHRSLPLRDTDADQALDDIDDLIHALSAEIELLAPTRT